MHHDLSTEEKPKQVTSASVNSALTASVENLSYILGFFVIQNVSLDKKKKNNPVTFNDLFF